MDDCMAAMVLMSLSCSPKSPIFPPDGVAFPQSWSSFDSGLTSVSTASRTSTPSPPTIYSHQTAAVDEYVQMKRSAKRVSSCDEGIEIDENLKFEEELEDNNQAPQRILFQCTWPRCTHISETCQEIERHVRVTHLGRSDQIVEDENSDHEEEFYYTEIEVDANSPSPLSNSSLSGYLPSSSLPKQLNGMYFSTNSQSPNISPSPLVESDSMPFLASSSAPTWSHLDMAKPPTEDPEYKRRFRFDHHQTNHPHHPHHHHQHPHHPRMITIKASNVAAVNGLAKLNGQKYNFISNPINIPGISFEQHYANMNSNNLNINSNNINNHINNNLNNNNNHHHHRPLNLSSPKAANLSNGNKFMRLSVNSKSGTTLLLSPNKLTTVSPTRRTRGETRKCRKMYGMDKRDAWCTQCKWKKACSRFVD